jgi:hypothetical protein
MIGGEQEKLLVSFDEDGNMQIDPLQAELLGLVENEFNWKLLRERDGLLKQSKEVMWIEFNEEGRFKSKYDEPAMGRSLIMSPFNDFFTWQTTTITEVISNREDYKEFKTKNSHYRLFKLDDNSRNG